MIVITSKYIKPMGVIESLIVDHRKFLDDCYKRFLFICSGPQNPSVGGVLIGNVASVAEAQEIMKKDPFTINGAAEYQYIEFSPNKYDDRFSCFIRKRTFQDYMRKQTEETEKEMIEHCLEECGGNVTHTAQRLCLSRKGLQLKMIKYNLRKEGVEKSR